MQGDSFCPRSPRWTERAGAYLWRRSSNRWRFLRYSPEARSPAQHRSAPYLEDRGLRRGQLLRSIPGLALLYSRRSLFGPKIKVGSGTTDLRNFLLDQAIATDWPNRHRVPGMAVSGSKCKRLRTRVTPFWILVCTWCAVENVHFSLGGAQKLLGTGQADEPKYQNGPAYWPRTWMTRISGYC